MLADLDELLLKCRNDRAKAYIGEALACCKAGAYRTAIIATWVSVAFDLIDKIRELALAGDKAAEEVSSRIESIVSDNDTVRLLQFERQLLDLAKNRFELISHMEYVDLDRLQYDRHRCAHPSQTAYGEVFTPAAELARLHIRNAVDHLLQHEPAQGKSALEGLVNLIDSNSFPTDQTRALEVLAGTPLRRARAALVRNLTVILVKRLLREENKYPQEVRRQRALLCIYRLRPAEWLTAVQEHVTPIVRSLSSDDELVRACELMYLDPAFADAFERDQVVRLEEFVARLPKEKFLTLHSVFDSGPLLAAATRRASWMSLDDVAQFDFLGLPRVVRRRVINAYSASANFDQANAWGKIIEGEPRSFNEEEIGEILRASLENQQIYGSFQLRRTIAAIRKAYGDSQVLKPLFDAVTQKMQ
jgi:hypothetical protein